MSFVTTHDPSQYSTRRVIPLPDGFIRNPVADKHFADIRKNDLVMVVRRVTPRALPPRDQARTYNTSLRARKHYFSFRQSMAAKQLATRERRPEDTRRSQVKMYGRADEQPLSMDYYGISQNFA
jgi:hypothetical protein